MKETDFKALRARWSTPPPEETRRAPSPREVAAESAAFMAFMGAHRALQQEVGG